MGTGSKAELLGLVHALCERREGVLQPQGWNSSSAAHSPLPAAQTSVPGSALAVATQQLPLTLTQVPVE